MPSLLRSRRWVVAGAWLWLTWGVIGLEGARGQGEAEALSASFRKASQRVLPAVVTVRAVGAELEFGPIGRGRRFGGPFPPPGPFGPGVFPPREPTGSGVVIDAEKGFVLTNDHVVQGASRVMVTLHDGRERPVMQVRRDPKSDLALLIIDGKGLAQAEWADSDALAIGDWVLAVGQPFGLSGTVTAGIISGKGRGIDEVQYEDLIQTDAAINPGNSGGPLVNLKGEIVGINTAIKTSGGGFEGVGFAVPANRARRVAADLAEHGRVRRAFLGIAIGGVEAGTAERLEQPGAVAITGVSKGSPAEEAGLRPGDVIVKLKGQPIRGVGSLQSAIETAPIGQPLTLEVDRKGERLEIEIRPRPSPEPSDTHEAVVRPFPDLLPGFGTGPGPGPAPGPPEPGFDPSGVSPQPETQPNDRTQGRASVQIYERYAGLGLTLSRPTASIVRQFRLEEPVNGLVIVAVEPGGPADRGGLEPGMVLIGVAERKLASIEDFRAAVSNRPVGRDLLVRIRKGAKTEFRVIPDQTNLPAGAQPGAGTPGNGSRDQEGRGGRELDPLPPPEGSKPDAPK